MQAMLSVLASFLFSMLIGLMILVGLLVSYFLGSKVPEAIEVVKSWLCKRHEYDFTIPPRANTENTEYWHTRHLRAKHQAAGFLECSSCRGEGCDDCEGTGFKDPFWTARKFRNEHERGY